MRSRIHAPAGPGALGAIVPPVHAWVSNAAATIHSREILDLIAAGASNDGIAASLFLAPKTVRNHITSIFRKMDVASRAEAIVRARRAGLGAS